MKRNAYLLFILDKMTHLGCLKIKYARGLLSKYLDEYVEHEELDESLCELAEQDLIKYHKDNFESIRLVDSSKSTYTHLYEEYMEKDLKKEITQYIIDFKEKSKAEKDDLIEKAFSDVSISEDPLEEIDLDQYFSNCAKCGFNISDTKLYLKKFKGRFWKGKLDYDMETTKAIKKMQEKLRDYYSKWFKIVGEADELYVITTYPYDFNLKLYGLTEPYLEKEEINDIQSLDNYKVLVEDMLKYFIDDNLKEMGYVLKESQKEKYLNFDKLEFIESSPVNFRKYDGFSLEVDLLSFREDEVSFLLWMDYSSTIVLSLFDYYNHLLESDKEVDKINRLKVKKFPEDHTLSIDSIGKEENLETKNKEYPDKSYLDYYHDKYGWSLDNKVQPFVKCTYDNIDNTKHFPIETLFIHRKSYSEVLNTDYEAELDLSPDERMRFFINLMKDLKKDMAGKSPHIEINDYPLTWGELENLDICKSGFKIRRPYVSFSKENQITSKDTRDIYNHGPYIGEKEIKISFILKPYKLDKDIVIESLSHICHSYNTSNFGTISFDKNHIFNYDPKADENTLREIIGDIEVTEKQKKRNAGVVILNKSPDDNYHIFKEIITQEHDIPTQMFTQKIIKEISNEEGSGRSKKSFLQIFNSTLKENESTWVLKNPADDENETMYVGLGYSYKPHEYENRASTFVSMCDAHGRNLSWKPMDIVVQKDRYITEKAFSKMAHRVYGKISEHENIGRIVFYRKGDLYENEINAMKNEIGDGFREIDSVDFLTIIQNPIARVFQKDDRGYYNPEKGLVFKFNGNKLLLLNSTISIRDKRETSMQPIILEKKLGDSKILDLGKEYFDISYLNWNDPIKLSKECLVLKLANKMAKMMKDLRTREPLKYFVL